MKEFTTICRDNITDNVMVLSECTFNQACDYLARKIGTDGYLGCEYAGGNVTKLKWRHKTFYYDEDREILMRYDETPKQKKARQAKAFIEGDAANMSYDDYQRWLMMENID